MSAAFAIAAGVVGVAGAATAAGMSMSAASRAAKAQGAASKAAARKEKKALKKFEAGQAQIQQQLGEVQAPVLDIGADISDAGRISEFYRQQQQAALGPSAMLGRQEAYELGRQQLAELAKMTAGEYSQADVQRLQRAAAESGIPVNIQTAGKGMGVPQAGQADFLRNLGMLPIQLKQMAFQYTPQVQSAMMGWTETARRFLTEEPLDVSEMKYRYGMGAADVGLRKIGVSADLLSSQYGARMNKAQSDYARQIANAEASAARDRVTQQSIQGMTSATSGALLGIGGAYGQLAAAQTPSTMYGSLGAAQSAAPYASGFSQVRGMGFVPRATAV